MSVNVLQEEDAKLELDMLVKEKEQKKQEEAGGPSVWAVGLTPMEGEKKGSRIE